MFKKLIHEKLDNWKSPGSNRIFKNENGVEYISFDIFDTLIKRDVPNPVDVFSIVAEICGISDFKEKRIEAEKKARELSAKHEITLKDIYAIYEGDNKQILEQTEIECEINISTINLEIIPLYRYCLENYKVILISDMYLPRNVIKQLLDKNGIYGYEKVFISNEVGKTKANGALFDYVCKKLQVDSKQLIHIGNSMKADYLMPRIHGIKSKKIETYKNRLQRDYGNVLKADKFKNKCLNSFINNRTSGENEYYRFGYETFGPLLYGFINWVFSEMKDNRIEQVLFLSRDGYIMKKLYDSLGYNKEIVSYYFEVSRRSLRIPSYCYNETFESIIKKLTVPNMTNITQIFDSLGLEVDNYRDIIKKNGIGFNDHLKRDKLIDNKEFRKLFEEISKDIIYNSTLEKENLLSYINTHDFSKKTAIVDIGWAGSMQKYLLETLDKMGIAHNIIGYYVGLTLKARDNIGKNGSFAKGYAFDCLNNKNDEELESAYIGLIETMFLEQRGSVKNYTQKENSTIANRYDYEYMNNDVLMEEAINVDFIQKGALQFSMDYKSSVLSEFIRNDNKIMYNNIHAVGTNPIYKNIKQFGKFQFFNCGDKVYLAHPNSFLYYVLHIKELKRDLFNSQWKIGFIKALLKLNLPYMTIFKILRKEANK